MREWMKRPSLAFYMVTECGWSECISDELKQELRELWKRERKR